MYPLTNAFRRWALDRRKRIDIGGGFLAWVAPMEYVILMKLEYYREGDSQKHLSYIRAVLEMKRVEIDRGVIRSHAREMGLENIWNRLSPEF